MDVLYSDCIAHNEHSVAGIVCYSGHKFQSSSGCNLCPSTESQTTPHDGLLTSTSESVWELETLRILLVIPCNPLPRPLCEVVYASSLLSLFSKVANK